MSIITPEMIEAGGKGLYEDHGLEHAYMPVWADLDDDTQHYWRALARACLESALPLILSEIGKHTPEIQCLRTRVERSLQTKDNG